MSDVPLYSTLISATQLRSLLASGKPVALFDCSFDLTNVAAGRAAYQQAHIPGAIYLHLDEDLSGPVTGRNGNHPLPDPQVFAKRLAEYGLSKGQQVVVYDAQNATWAPRAWWMLRELGHEAVAVLDGGFQAWRAAGGAVESGAVAVKAPGNFSVTRQFSSIVDVDDVVANIARQSFLVVDARAPERYRGEEVLAVGKPGHIPGAVNRFYKDNLTASGEFKSPQQLASELGSVLGDVPASAAVLQCGSGVTACVNALAFEVAGLSRPRLYPGSYSQWISDPSRPVAKP